MNVRELRVFLNDLDGDMPVWVLEADCICPRDAVPRVLVVDDEKAVLL